MKKLVLFLIVILAASSFAAPMDKAELLAAVSSSYVKVGDPYVIANDTVMNVKWYETPVFEAVTDSIGTIKTVQFYVIDEGTATEKAYLVRALPSFSETVKAKVAQLKEFISQYNGVIEQIDEENGWAKVVICTTSDGGINFTEARYFVWPKVGGGFNYAPIN